MKNKMNGVHKPVVLGICLSGIACPVLATSDLSLSVGAGLESHDNAALSSTDEQSDTKRLINTDIGYKKADGVLNIDMGYSAEYGDYQKDVEGDQTAINGSTSLKWLIAPRQLDAIFNHQISQQLTDRRGLDVKSNREERSVTTAGLDGFVHFSSVDSIVLSPRFTDVRFSESNNSDSQRAAMMTTWDHKISSVSALDLSVNYDHVTFDDSLNDYNLSGAMLSFKTTLSRLSYELGLGANRISRDSGEDVNGSRVNALVDYHGGEGRDWGVSYIHLLTDTSIGMSGVELTSNNFSANDSNSNQFDIITEDKLDAYWRDKVSASSQFSLGGGYQKEDYKDTPRDQSVAYGEAGYQYTINSRWSTGIDGRYEHTKFLDDPTDEYNTTRVYLNVTYHPLRPLAIRFAIGQDKRDADTSSNSYTDKVFVVGFQYRVF